MHIAPPVTAKQASNQFSKLDRGLGLGEVVATPRQTNLNFLCKANTPEPLVVEAFTIDDRCDHHRQLPAYWGHTESPPQIWYIVESDPRFVNEALCACMKRPGVTWEARVNDRRWGVSQLNLHSPPCHPLWWSWCATPVCPNNRKWKGRKRRIGRHRARCKAWTLTMSGRSGTPALWFVGVPYV